jgi:hypothetical protein
MSKNLNRRGLKSRIICWISYKYTKSSYLLLALIMGLLTLGCSSTLHETYYLKAYDPQTQAINYFRINLSGVSTFSKTKFSVGFYDRNAVERLFGETAVSQEFLSTQVEVFDKATGKKLQDISANLQAAKVNTQEFAKERLITINASIADLIGQYETRLATNQKLKEQLQQSIDSAKTLREAGEAALKSGDLIAAMANLRVAYATMEAIRIAADSKVLVRFFDGAGNEIDVNTKTMVIFVATDVSRFAEAIRQLAESNDSAQDVLRIVLGPKIKEAEALKTKLSASNKDEGALIKLLNDKVTNWPEKPDANGVKTVICETATAVAGKIGTFQNSKDIREFIKGMGVQ